MPVRIVQSKHNARLKELRRALTKPARDGAVAIEGPILIAEALRAGLRFACIFAAHESEHLLADLPIPSDLEILLFPRLVLNSALTTENPQSIAALVHPTRWSWNDAIAQPTALLLILAAVQDPGNLGTILRSADAFGTTGVICLPGTVSEWNPKVLRASAGSVFRVPILHAEFGEAFSTLRKAKVKILATTAHGAPTATSLNLAGPTALIIGNEGNGIPAELAAQADGAITIPCPGPVESLNAAVATSILLYEIARQRATAPAQKGRGR